MNVSMCVMYVRLCFRRALRYGAETSHEGTGKDPEVCGHICEATPPKVKGHLEVKLL